MFEETKPSPRTRREHRSPLQVLRVLLVAAASAGIFWAASGARNGNEIDNHRLIVAQCWNALERKSAEGRSLADETQACQRMERGFAQMYGRGA